MSYHHTSYSKMPNQDMIYQCFMHGKTAGVAYGVGTADPSLSSSSVCGGASFARNLSFCIQCFVFKCLSFYFCP